MLSLCQSCERFGGLLLADCVIAFAGMKLNDNPMADAEHAAAASPTCSNSLHRERHSQATSSACNKSTGTGSNLSRVQHVSRFSMYSSMLIDAIKQNRLAT